MGGQRQTSLIDVDDKAFLSTLKEAFAELELQSGADLERVGIQVVNKAKGFCPVATGRLRASITASPLGHDSDGAFVDVGSDVTYAAPVEYGTSKMRAQPWLRPALAEVTHGDFKQKGENSGGGE